MKMTSKLPVQPNPAATFTDQRTQSIISNRSHVRIAPKYGGPYKAGNIIRLEIPSQDWLDPDLFSISFNAILKNAAGTGIQAYGSQDGGLPCNGVQAASLRFDTPLQMIFSRIKLLQGSTVIEDILDYGTLYKMLSVTTVNKQYNDTMAGVFEGCYDTCDQMQLTRAKQRHAWSTGAADAAATPVAPIAVDREHYFTYNVRPLLGLLRAGKYLPLKWMGQLTIELYLEQPANCLVSSVAHVLEATDGGDLGNLALTTENAKVYPTVITAAGTGATAVVSPTVASTHPLAYYEIDQVNMECHFVQPLDEYDRSVLSLIEENGLSVWFDTFSTHTRQLATNGGRNTVSFQERAVSLKGGYCVMQNDVDIGDYRTPVSFPDNQMQEYQWKLGSQYYPAQPVICHKGAGTALFQLQNSFDAFGDMATTGMVHEDNFTGKRYYTHAGRNANNTATLVANYGKTARWEEILAESSLPNNFVMALNLEKTPDQLSGFNSAAASVDVELITNTKAANDADHVVTATAGTATVLNDGHTFQPSKFLCNFSTATAAVGARTSNTRHFNKDQPADTQMMITKNPANYARMTFFGHIDSVIKIARVGNLEVMR